MMDFEQAQEVFLKAEKVLKKAQEKFSAARKVRDELCPHTELIPKEYYFSGSYLDQAYSEYWNECACCGQTSERTTKQHSWYG
jgi:predicted dithiol-disulfide oxidoreductase (DUF899 family)